MSLLRFLVPYIALSGCASVPRPIPDFPLARTANNTSVSVRVDVARHGHGSGVVLSKDGLILTCEHVVRHVGRPAIVASVSDGNGRTMPATIVATDPSRDLALLKVDADFDLAADLDTPAGGSRGSRIYGIGFPGTRNREVARGIIKRYPFDVDMRPAEPANFRKGVLAEMPTGGGTSGQGVFSAESGKLLGVHKMSFRSDEGSDMSILVSAEEIRSFLDENGIELK